MHNAFIIIIVIYYLPKPRTCQALRRHCATWPQATTAPGQALYSDGCWTLTKPCPRWDASTTAPAPAAKGSFLLPLLTPELLRLVMPSLLVDEKTDVLLEDIRFLVHFIQNLISQTILIQDARGLHEYDIN